MTEYRIQYRVCQRDGSTEERAGTFASEHRFLEFVRINTERYRWKAVERVSIHEISS